jgi:subtilisin family serine protease
MASPQKPESRSTVSEQIVGEKVHCLIAPRRSKSAKAAGVVPMSAGSMRSTIAQLEKLGCEIVKELKPRSAVKTMSAVNEATNVYVARMDPDTAQMLSQSAPPNLIVEEDAYLSYGTRGPSLLSIAPRVGALRSTKGINAQTIKLRVVGENNEPITNAKVTLEGDGFPQDGETDKNGEVTLKLFSITGSGQARSLFVNPQKDYWTRYITDPALSETDVNIVGVHSLKQTVVGFPDHFRYGWGQTLMGLDQMPDECTGKGIKIAIIDSGADNSHPLLKHINHGIDLTNNNDPTTWSKDVVGHGSHCAGIITAQNTTEMALRGFAPEAEIFIYKVFPGGQFSSLLDALDHCIEENVDVVNMSLGSPQVSEAIEQKLEEVVENGIACVVAAGNSGGPVQYPARSPNVLAVSAIGRLNEFPPKSWDSQTVIPGLVAPDGVFSPSFTCFGPQVDVSAPGVAIISTVPDNGFEAESGTSMAAPHITGLAALYLAHHPAFQGALKARNAQRVAGLFNMIKSSTAAYQFGAERTGVGIPTLHGLVQTIMATTQPTVGGVQTVGQAAQMPPATGAGVPPSALQTQPYNVLGGQLGAMLGGIIGNILGGPQGAQIGQTLGGLAPFQSTPGTTIGGTGPTQPTQPGTEALRSQMFGVLGNQQGGRWWYPWT